MSIRYIFFDLGNVLVHFDPNDACRNVSRLVGHSEAAVFSALYGSGVETRYERGELDCEAFATAFRAELGCDCDSEDLLREMSAMFRPNQAMQPLLDRLIASEPRLGILSNTCPAHWNWVQQQAWSVSSGWFGEAVLSYEVGRMKPEPEIYQAAQSIAGVPADQIFFTDDRLENIEAAREAGWRAELFHDAELLTKQLTALLPGL
ncbi:HAD family hydrolase [Planctomycetaceae bacterium SH139]